MCPFRKSVQKVSSGIERAGWGGHVAPSLTWGRRERKRQTWQRRTWFFLRVRGRTKHQRARFIDDFHGKDGHFVLFFFFGVCAVQCSSLCVSHTIVWSFFFSPQHPCNMHDIKLGSVATWCITGYLYGYLITARILSPLPLPSVRACEENAREAVWSGCARFLSHGRKKQKKTLLLYIGTRHITHCEKKKPPSKRHRTPLV